MMEKLNKGSMKSLVVAIGFLSLTAISCTKSDESLQPNQSEIESRRGGRSGGGSTGDTPPANGIPQPTGLSAIAVGPTQVNLSWNSVPGATTYRIYRDIYVPAIITETSYSDKSVRPGTTYSYAIAAVVNGTLGPKSGWVTVTTPQ